MDTRRIKVNHIGLARDDYKGAPTTLCQGCGHNSISSQIVAVAWEVGLKPHEVIKTSGIGCSSKSPAYFLSQSHGFNTLHGRMPSVTTGAMLTNHHLRAIGVSGDGDTASIGLGQFKHTMRRNVRMVYIIENNGVYGLTKGQFSATADEGQQLKYAGRNDLPPADLCMEAIISGAGFVARSFSGDAKQVRELLKAALSYDGTAVLDIISPCVTFNNHDESTKSYGYGKEHQESLHDISWVPVRDEIRIESPEDGSRTEVQMHDGSWIVLNKLDSDYDPTDKLGAMHRLQWAHDKREFITGLIYLDQNRPRFSTINGLGETPISQMGVEKLAAPPEKLRALMDRLHF
jgi:2-oxoglutarate ferredoxin oxidoreductase subunit beta